MKMILSTLAAVTLLAGSAQAGSFDSFNDPSQALPRSQSFEQALPRTSNDDYRQALPRSVEQSLHGSEPAAAADGRDVPGHRDRHALIQRST